MDEDIAGASKCICLYQKLRHLENELKEYKNRNDVLAHALDEESLKREMAEANLYSHKEALLEKSNELQERDQTIETQNTLLAFAWAESQNNSASIRDQNQRISFLTNQIEQMRPEKIQESSNRSVNKKRKFSP